VIWNWWRGHAKAHYDGIVAFSQTDFTEDLKKITVPVLVMHGDDDQIVPYADSAPLSAKLLKNSTLKTYKGFPHGMPRTETDTIDADLLTETVAPPPWRRHPNEPTTRVVTRHERPARPVSRAIALEPETDSPCCNRAPDRRLPYPPGADGSYKPRVDAIRDIPMARWSAS
jgi:predicted dienelactone hydrolase